MTPLPDKQKPKRSTQDTFSWLDVVIPRQPVIQYGTESSPEEVIEAIKMLSNHTSRKVVVAKKPTPQGLIYSFRVEFQVVTGEARGDTLRRHERMTAKQVDGTVMTGTEYPTIIELTPERLTISLQVIAGFFFLMFAVLTLDLPPIIRIPLIVFMIFSAGTLFLGPYLYVTYGPRNRMLEQRMTDVMDKLGATKISDAKDSGPKPKRRAPAKTKIES